MRKRFWPLFGSLFALCVFAMVSKVDASPIKRPLSFQSFTQKQGLSSDMVFAVTAQEEAVWFGTYAGGATLYDKMKKIWKPYTTKGEPPAKADDGNSIKWKNLLPYNHVSVIVPDTNRVWFGTYFYGFGGGGVSYYEPYKTPSWKALNTNGDRAKKVVSLAVDGDMLWVGSEKGLSLLDKKTEAWKGFYSAQNGVSGNFVNGILVQPDSTWVATNGGIGRFQKSQKSWKTYSLKEGLAEQEIKSLIQVGKRIWAGGIGGSLIEYDPAADYWKKIEATDSCKNGGINAMLAGREMVIICRDNGVSLCDLSTGRWESLTGADGLLSNTVFCAAEDKDGIWFGTDKGVSRLILTR
jgi:ligand-binding sensor domain-containing protein